MIEVTQTDSGLALRMAATLDAIDEADDCVTAYLRSHEVPVDEFAARILLREALLNAVTHGSEKDPGKTVTLGLVLDGHGLTMTVEDSGAGFAWRDRSKTLDVLADGGRGLALMETFSDSMEFNERGNRVVLRKEFGTPAATPGGPGDRHEETNA